MLSKLYIKNYVLIDSLEIDFPAGLVIITGQTGAGKSILLGALNLVLGGKSDANMIGDADESCVVEAVFDVPKDEDTKQIILENDLDWDNGRLTIRRVINKVGRARAFVNDSPVSVSVLNQFSSRLLDIHSQNETMLLTDKKFQLSILDYFANDIKILEEYKKTWNLLLGHKKNLNELKAQLSKYQLEQDFNKSLLEKLEEANLVEGELEELEAEQKKLANAEEIKSSLCNVEELLAPTNDEMLPIDSLLKEVEKYLDKISAFVPETSDLSKRVESSRLELDDILSEIYELESNTEVSQDRLEFVEDRMSLLYDLLKKHNCSSITELIKVKEGLETELGIPENLEFEIQKLEKLIPQVEKELNGLAEKLSQERRKAAPVLADNVQKSLKFLELDHSIFKVAVDEVDLNINGKDSVSFLFSSTGKNPIDVAKCASGGEKSRIMLCLKALMATYAEMPSMVFDEIDTGVSGSVADKMGSMICSMGKGMQVSAITHLPQVAAKGNAHFVVTKTIDSSRATTDIKQISGESRVEEIARLLSGATITKEAIANAKSLLGM